MNLTSCYLTGFHYNLEQLQNFLVTKVTLDEEVAEEDLDEEVSDEDLDEEVADGDFEEDAVTLDLGNEVAEKEEDNDEDALQSLHLVLSSDENTVEECTLDELEEVYHDEIFDDSINDPDWKDFEKYCEVSTSSESDGEVLVEQFDDEFDDA